MRCLFTTILLLFIFSGNAQDWAWMQGSQNVNNLPVWGIKGVANPTNNPGARLGAASWTDNNGNFWLFGGLHGGAYLNDLWIYSFSTKMWTWMKGDNFFGSMGSYGIKGVPSPSNIHQEEVIPQHGKMRLAICGCMVVKL